MKFCNSYQFLAFLVALLFSEMVSASPIVVKGAMPSIIVVGVDHRVQNFEPTCLTPEGKESAVEQRAALRARLEELILQHQPQLIGEEEEPGVGSIGKVLADAHGLKYCTLSMPVEARLKVGIDKDYRKTLETCRAAYEVFESFMFEQIQSSRGDATSILAICGSDHAERLASLFAKAGLNADVEDTYYATWYRGWPIEEEAKVIRFDKERCR